MSSRGQGKLVSRDGDEHESLEQGVERDLSKIALGSVSRARREGGWSCSDQHWQGTWRLEGEQSPPRQPPETISILDTGVVARPNVQTLGRARESEAMAFPWSLLLFYP